MRDLQKDLEICQAATPEPWIAENVVLGDGARVTVINSNGITIAYLHRFTDEMPVNATFIIEAREGWSEAIRRAMEAEAQKQELEAVIQRKCRWCDLIGECGEKDCPLWPYHKKEGGEQDA